MQATLVRRGFWRTSWRSIAPRWKWKSPTLTINCGRSGELPKWRIESMRVSGRSSRNSDRTSARSPESAAVPSWSMPDQPAPDPTAVRTALWRAMHVQVDPPPHVLEDEIGLRLAAPDDGWRDRPDMNPQFTRPFRASIVARARFIEDLVIEQARGGVS